MYPRFPRELVADLLGSAEHTLGTTSLVVRIEVITCGVDVHGSVHRNIKLIERTNKMQPCNRFY